MAAFVRPEPPYAMSAGRSVAVYIGTGAFALDGAIIDRTSQFARQMATSTTTNARGAPADGTLGVTLTQLVLSRDQLVLCFIFGPVDLATVEALIKDCEFRAAADVPTAGRAVRDPDENGCNGNVEEQSEDHADNDHVTTVAQAAEDAREPRESPAILAA